MSMTRSVFKRKMELVVVGGQNRFSKRPKKSYVMKKVGNDGIVKVAGNEFYFYGFDHNQAHTRSAGKTAGGAIAGGILAGPLGAIAGGAVGARKKNTSRATLIFAPVLSPADQFSVVVECDDYLHGRLSRLPVAVEPAE